MKENTQFFYLRRLKGQGNHRVGGMAIRRIENTSKFFVAASLCSDDDEFSPSYAKNSAIGRLSSSEHRVTIGYGDKESFNLVLHGCGIKAKSENFNGVLENNKNDLAFKRALDTLIGNMND